MELARPPRITGVEGFNVGEIWSDVGSELEGVDVGRLVDDKLVSIVTLYVG
jgi:hypothetical protein